MSMIDELLRNNEQFTAAFDKAIATWSRVAADAKLKFE